MTTKITKTEEEWQRELTPEQYEVLRRQGTEPPFTGKYTYSKEDGMYRCAACGNELFSSDTKFDSGTGWPSFYEPATAEAVELRDDSSHGMTPHRGRVRALRRPPRPRLPRRAEPDRPALLHQLPVTRHGRERGRGLANPEVQVVVVVGDRLHDPARAAQADV